MPRHDKKGRRKSGPPFIQIFYLIIDSQAWLSLTAAARAIYLQIARRYNDENNGVLAVSVRSLADECNVAPNTVTTSISQLITVGLIERMQEGSFANKVRLAAEYRLTAFKCNKTGRSASHAYRAWTTSGPRAVEGEISNDEPGS